MVSKPQARFHSKWTFILIKDTLWWVPSKIEGNVEKKSNDPKLRVGSSLRTLQYTISSSQSWYAASTKSHFSWALGPRKLSRTVWESLQSCFKGCLSVCLCSTGRITSRITLAISQFAVGPTIALSWRVQSQFSVYFSALHAVSDSCTAMRPWAVHYIVGVK